MLYSGEAAGIGRKKHQREEMAEDWRGIVQEEHVGKQEGLKILQSSGYTHASVHTWNANQVTYYLKTNMSWTGM